MTLYKIILSIILYVGRCNMWVCGGGGGGGPRKVWAFN